MKVPCLIDHAIAGLITAITRAYLAQQNRALEVSHNLRLEFNLQQSAKKQFHSPEVGIWNRYIKQIN